MHRLHDPTPTREGSAPPPTPTRRGSTPTRRHSRRPRSRRLAVTTLCLAALAGASLPCSLKAEPGPGETGLALPGLPAVHQKALRRAEELARQAAELADDGRLDEAELAYYEALLVLPREPGTESLIEAWREGLLEILRARERIEELPEGGTNTGSEDEAPALFPETWNLSMSASEKAVLIRLPAVSLRDAPLTEALAFLQAASAVHDASPLSTGVVLELSDPEARGEARVTLRLVRATLEEALRQTAEQAACDLRYERTRVRFVPREGETPPSLHTLLADLAETPAPLGSDETEAAEAGGDVGTTEASGSAEGEAGSEPSPTPDPASLLWYRAYLLLSAAEEAEAGGEPGRALEIYRDAELPLTLLGDLFPDFAPEVVAERQGRLAARLGAGDAVP